jgi:RES domain-containing protein
MQNIYRLTKARYADTAFSGEGSMRYDGCWHRRGIRIAYASDAPPSALLEVIAHTEAPSRLQHEYVLFEIQLYPDEHLLTVDSDMLPDDWRTVPWPASTQEIGTFWYEEQSSVVLSVPSAVVPRQRNFLVNVTHPRFDELQIQGPEPFEIDSRLA